MSDTTKSFLPWYILSFGCLGAALFCVQRIPGWLLAAGVSLPGDMTSLVQIGCVFVALLPPVLVVPALPTAPPPSMDFLDTLPPPSAPNNAQPAPTPATKDVSGEWDFAADELEDFSDEELYSEDYEAGSDDEASEDTLADAVPPEEDPMEFNDVIPFPEDEPKENTASVPTVFPGLPSDAPDWAQRLAQGVLRREISPHASDREIGEFLRDEQTFYRLLGLYLLKNGDAAEAREDAYRDARRVMAVVHLENVWQLSSHEDDEVSGTA